MNRRKVCLLAAAFLTAAGGVLGATYTWTGGGADDDWNTCGNWTTPGPFYPCSPSTTDHDAVIPGGSVNLIDEEIDDLSVTDDVDFADAEENPVLVVDSFSVGADRAVVVHFGGMARIAGDLQTQVCGG